MRKKKLAVNIRTDDARFLNLRTNSIKLKQRKKTQ